MWISRGACCPKEEIACGMVSWLGFPGTQTLSWSLVCRLFIKEYLGFSTYERKEKPRTDQREKSMHDIGLGGYKDLRS